MLSNTKAIFDMIKICVYKQRMKSCLEIYTKKDQFAIIMMRDSVVKSFLYNTCNMENPGDPLGSGCQHFPISPNVKIA